MYKKLYWTGIVAWCMLFVLAYVFYLERTVFVDTAFSFFHIVRKASYCVQLNRFGEAISQLPAIIATKLQLPLSAIAQLYSIGFVLLQFSCYLLLGWRMGRYELGIVLLLFNLLFASHTFFWPISQAPQGIALLLVVWALLASIAEAGAKPMLVAALVLLVVTVAFLHPLAAVVHFYMVGYYVIRKGMFSNKILVSMALLYLVILVIKFLFFRSVYEQHAFGGLKHVYTFFPHYFGTFSWSRFWANCLSHYYWLPMAWILVVVHYMSQRRFLLTAYVTLAVWGYLFIVNVSYSDSSTPNFYIENLYLPLAVIVSLPLAIDVLPGLKSAAIWLIWVSVLLSGILRIVSTSASYTQRLNWQRTQLKQLANEKVIIKTSPSDAAIMLMDWCSPYEFWLLSTIETGQSASIIFDPDPGHRDWAKGHTKDFIVNWNIFPYSQLNPKYFIFSDTISGYRLIDRDKTEQATQK